MGSLYKFDVELKRKYPDIKKSIDSKDVKKIMENIIRQETSIQFIKSYLKDKGYLYVDVAASVELKVNKESIMEVSEHIIESRNSDKDKQSDVIAKVVKNDKVTSVPIDNDEDDFDLDNFLNSDEFQNKMKKNEQIKGFENNKNLFKKLENYSSQTVKDEIVIINMSLVRKIAAQYIHAPTGALVYDDLVSEGVLGLMKAIDRYKLEYGYEFSTYAYYWIKQSISRAIANQALLIRLPVHLQETLNKINKFEREYWKEDKDSDIREIAERCGLSIEKYYEMKIIESNFRRQTSLNTPLKEDSQEDILMTLEQKSSIWYEDSSDISNPVQVADIHALQSEVNHLFTYLTEREELVIRLRYGMDGHEPKTLEEIGKILKVTRERIRQIEAKSLKKLRKYSEKRELPLFLSS